MWCDNKRGNHEKWGTFRGAAKVNVRRLARLDAYRRRVVVSRASTTCRGLVTSFSFAASGAHVPAPLT